MPLDETFPGIKVEQNGFTFYLSALPATRILRLGQGIRRQDEIQNVLGDVSVSEEDRKAILNAIESSQFQKEVSTITRRSYGKEDPFQRVVDEARIKELAAYLLEPEALIPNAMILATRDSTDAAIAPNGQLVNISLHSNDKFAVNIIDGQHRIEALRLLIRDGRTEFEDFMMPFTLLVDYPFYLQAELFAVVNGKQKPVNRSRVYDLYGYRELQDDNEKERAYRGQLAIERFCHQVVRILNESRVSPWHKKIKMRGTGTGVVTQAAFIDELKALVTPRKDTRKLTRLPVLYPFFREGNLTGAAKACIVYFMGTKNAWPDQWANNDHLKSSLFGRTLGIGVCFRVFHDLVIICGGASKLTANNSRDFWKKAPEEVIQQPPPTGGRGIQRNIYNQCTSEKHRTESRDGSENFETMRGFLKMKGGLI